MALAPKRIHRRHNRTVTPATRDFVRKRHVRKKRYKWERWLRAAQRMRRKAASLKQWAVQFAIILVLGAIVAALGILLFSPILNIREIRVQRTDPRIDIDRVQEALQPLFGRHLFLLPSQEVAPLLRSDGSSTKGVADMTGLTVHKEYPSSLVLTLQLDPIIDRVEIVDPDAGSETQTGSALQGYLTEGGMYVQYREDQIASGSVLPLLRIVDWGVRPAPWATLLEPTFLERMQQTEEALRTDFGQAVRERTVYLRAREFHLLMTDGLSLWFDVRSSVDDHMSRYRTFLRTLGRDAANDYVDLRLSDKVVYR